MRIVIIEDEMHNYRMLNGMIEKLRPEWTVLVHLDGVKKSVEWFKTNQHPDLVFMDIQLADGICFSIFEQIELTCPIIFTTAYDNYAIQAFKVNSVDYLLKPIKESDLQIAILKFEQLFDNDKGINHVDFSEIFKAIKGGEKKYRKRFLVNGTKNYYQIKSEDIAYFYSVNKVTTAVTFNNQEHIVDFPLDSLEEEMDPEIFFRANRQYTVNIEAIDKIEDYFNGKLILKTLPLAKETISISRLKAMAFKDWVNR